MNQHRIHRVAKLTGLSRDVIRVWERRFGLIQPTRGANRYRLYSDEDVALLRYVKAELDKGRSIGELVALGSENLRAQSRASAPAVPQGTYARVLAELEATLTPLNPSAFEARLNGAVAVIPFDEALRGILVPLQIRVGDLWAESKLDVSVEHYVTKQVQQKLFTAMNQMADNEAGRRVVVACGPEELHEMGAHVVAYLCKLRGYRVHYLGARVPVPALAAMCLGVTAAVALVSLTLPIGKVEADTLAKQLLDHVRPLCPVWVGGQGSASVEESLTSHRLEVIGGLSDLEKRLARL
jgi:DNA-binding transcriptional MerR regulator/methylmalonyl-CoA mutase cobalamin-binding subunit